ncbi:MAG: hypothetical protein IJW17_02990 [Lentisphaeria bacterium]|nr:hypothetical protein [Lentisphaeria bacterium]
MNNLIWHYTSLEVLKSIFLEKEPRLRATHFQQFFDKNEFHLAGDYLIEEMYKSNQWANSYYHVFLKNLLSKVRFRDDYYVISFSRSCDNYCMWKNYASGGCSIGFQACIVPRLFSYNVFFGDMGGLNYQPEYGRLLDCRYLTDDECDKLWNRRLELQSGGYFEDLIKVKVFASLLADIFNTKRCDYFFENETRLVLRYVTDKRFAKCNILSPFPYHENDHSYLYCPFNQLLKKQPIQIMFAPDADIKEGESIVKEIIRKHGLNITMSYGKSVIGDCAKCMRPSNCKNCLK